MAKCRLVACLVLISGMLAGCRCCPLMNPYANAIDDINDTHLYFDNWYNPRLDVSRAGWPDWCGPINRRLWGRCCCQGEWDRYDECHLYPPSYPYSFPGDAMAEQREKRSIIPAASPEPPTVPPAPTPEQ